MAKKPDLDPASMGAMLVVSLVCHVILLRCCLSQWNSWFNGMGAWADVQNRVKGAV